MADFMTERQRWTDQQPLQTHIAPAGSASRHGEPGLSGDDSPRLVCEDTRIEHLFLGPAKAESLLWLLQDDEQGHDSDAQKDHDELQQGSQYLEFVM